MFETSASRPKIALTIVYSEDWAVLYVDDAEYYQGHSIPDHQLLRAVVGTCVDQVRTYGMTGQGEEWLMEEQRFPVGFSLIPKEYLSSPWREP